jgi:hypothetical protein
MPRRSPCDKVLLALSTHRGQMSRSEVSATFFRRYSKAQLDALLSGPLSGLVSVEKRPLPPKRRVWVWSLTSDGWARVNAMEAGKSPLCLNSEELKRQLVRLVKEGDPWAETILNAKRFYDARSKPLSEPELIEALTRTWKESPTHSDRIFARRVLRSISKSLAPDPQKRPELPRRKHTSHPLSEADIARLNAVRERLGEEPIGAPRHPRESVTPEPEPPAPPKPAIHAPVVDAAHPEHVFRFASGDCYRHGCFGGQKITVRTYSGKSWWDGKEVKVLETDLCPAAGWKLNYDTAGWEPTAPLQPPPPRRGYDPRPVVSDPTRSDPLLTKIRQAGYTVNARGEVRYDCDKWIPASEWVKRMGWTSEGPQ